MSAWLQPMTNLEKREVSNGADLNGADLPTNFYKYFLAHTDHVSNGVRVSSRHDVMKSGVPGVQHVDVASGREGELCERPQVVLPGSCHFGVLYIFFHPPSLRFVRLPLSGPPQMVRLAHGDG